MNLTLSINSQLLKEARKVAIEMDTSVNALVRDYLSHLVEKKKAEKSLFIDEWLRLMDENPIKMTARQWKRDELHER